MPGRGAWRALRPRAWLKPWCQQPSPGSDLGKRPEGDSSGTLISEGLHGMGLPLGDALLPHSTAGRRHGGQDSGWEPFLWASPSSFLPPLQDLQTRGPVLQFAQLQ